MAERFLPPGATVPPRGTASDNGGQPLPSLVLHWYSPFPLSEPVLAQLEQAGLQPLQEPPGEDQQPALLLYDTPDRLLEATDLGSAALLEGYRTLLGIPLSSPRLAVWRLAGQGELDGDIRSLFLSSDPSSEANSELTPPEPAPLTALVATALCSAVPGLLDAYLDLELQARLLGGEPDVDYLRRLQGALKPEPLLESWRTPAGLTLELEDLRGQLRDTESALSEAREEAGFTHSKLSLELEDLRRQLREQLRDTESALSEAREEAELTLLQLHQVQEELEQIFLADREKQHLLQGKDQEVAELREQLEGRGQEISELRAQLEGRGQEVAELREQLEGRGLEVAELREQLEGRGQEVVELREQLEGKEGALTDAREEAELTLLQLHQVQEELEHYFLLARGQQALLQRHEELEQRSERLLVSLRRG